MQITIGLGMPRSGTKSLKRLLGSQEGLKVRHESKPRLPWEKDEQLFRETFPKFFDKQQKKVEFVAEVAFYFLNYVFLFLEYDPKTKFVCLKRKKEDVIRSLCWRSGSKNPYREEANHSYAKNFPTFTRKQAKDKKSGIALHYDYYYQEAERLVKRYPESFKLFESPKVLNSKAERERLLSWIGYPLDKVNHDIEYRVDRITREKLEKEGRISLLEKMRKGKVK